MTVANSELLMVRYDKMKHISMCVNEIVYGNIHEHSALEVGLVLSGKVKVLCESGECQAEAGDILLFNAYEPHALRSVSQRPARVMYMQISTYFGREYLAKLPNTEFDTPAVLCLPNGKDKEIRDHLTACARVFFREEEGFQLECAGHAGLLLSTLLRYLPHHQSTDAESVTKKKRTGRMQRITGYIEQHYKEKLTLSELAKAEGLTTAYMSRVFKELFHMSFQEYLNLLRLERALPLIRDTSMYLVDICMECGFSDTRYLNSVCRKEFGCNASEYRRRHAANKTLPLTGKLHKEICEPVCGNQESLRLLESFCGKP